MREAYTMLMTTILFVLFFIATAVMVSSDLNDAKMRRSLKQPKARQQPKLRKRR